MRQKTEAEHLKMARLIAQGTAPDRVRVRGALKIHSKTLEFLPPSLAATALDVSGCPNLRALPENLQVRRLNISACRHLEKWPESLELFSLEARNTMLQEVPRGWRVESRVDLSECVELHSLPEDFQTGSLVLRGCTALQQLPENLEVFFLDIAGCSALKSWPQKGRLRIGKLDATGCAALQELPAWLGDLSQLNISFCPQLNSLPEGLRVASWLDVAESGVRELPKSLQGVNLRWKNVPVDARIAFAPETIEAGEVLNERNAEVRRVMLERMGTEKFLSQAQAQLLDSDRDPGGARRLLRVDLFDDEPLVCLAVQCPSTAHHYMLRVPPTTRSCRQAAAWLAGFDNPDDYRPLQET